MTEKVNVGHVSLVCFFLVHFIFIGFLVTFLCSHLRMQKSDYSKNINIYFKTFNQCLRMPSAVLCQFIAKVTVVCGSRSEVRRETRYEEILFFPLVQRKVHNDICRARKADQVSWKNWTMIGHRRRRLYRAWYVLIPLMLSFINSGADGQTL